MTSGYILIMWIVSGAGMSARPPAIATANFGSMEACEAAAKGFKDSIRKQQGVERWVFYDATCNKGN